ncbi:MAG: hypothetical protein IKW45_03730 [Clostridia bacterium]|nr:hypothetical protein [Clostridia bacterium]
MTTEIEKQFFEAFEIETEEKFYCLKGYCNQNPSVKMNSTKCRNCKNGNYYISPEITWRRFLELLRICLNNDFVIHSKDLAELKEKALFLLARNKCPHLKTQIQAVFKEIE